VYIIPSKKNIIGTEFKQYKGQEFISFQKKKFIQRFIRKICKGCCTHIGSTNYLNKAGIESSANSREGLEILHRVNKKFSKLQANIASLNPLTEPHKLELAKDQPLRKNTLGYLYFD